MEVITVADGRSAFEKMVQVVPDLVLADVYMPEVDGYELCRSIKQDARFAKTPVMLLISSFEPFDEAEARRAGADDVVTKPFQSIRQLVSRVGSLLNKGVIEPQLTDEYPLEMNHTESIVPGPIEELPSEAQVTVLVEAPIMEHVEPAEPPGAACSTDVELQTADTMKLERVVDEPIKEPVREDNLTMEDTVEVEPVEAVASDDFISVEPEPEPVEVSYTGTIEPVAQTAPPAAMKLDDSVLDLEDEFLAEPQMVGDDVFLDLDFADTVPAEFQRENFAEVAPAIIAPNTPAAVAEEVPMVAAEEVSTPIAFEPTFAEPAVELEQPTWPAIDEAPVVEMQEASSPGLQSFPEPAPEPIIKDASAPLTAHEVEGLSPAAIDAIARRMVEQMSDKVIREIAWEVVPELSELLIKQKLEEQK